MDYPPVSVVMPVRNEERHLAESVRHVLGQDYPGEFELVLAVGPSADRTERIAAGLAAAEPRLTVVPNPTGQIPAALNAAVGAARHGVIARVDGHALLPPGYLTRAVETLAQTGAADVGGVMAADGQTPFQQAVAWAMTSKAGVGSASFHTGGGAGPALSVYLGVYQRAAIEQAGGWDEGMLRAEDWELNHRIRARGGTVWFTPDLRVTYRPRASVRTLASQYFHYGRWRRVIVREHPETASFRYLAPPGAAALVTAGLAIGIAGVAATAAGAPAALRLADGRLRDPGDLRGRHHRRGHAAVPGPPGHGQAPDTARPRHHAPGLGDRLPHQPAQAAPPPARHACRSTGGQHGKPGSGWARIRHGLRPPGPARRAPQRWVRAVRPVPEPAAAQGAAHDRLRQGLRASRRGVPVRLRRPPVRRLPGRLRRVRGRPQPPGDQAGAAPGTGRPASRLDPVRLRPAARPAGGKAPGQGARPGPRVLLQQRHRGGGVGAEVRPLRDRAQAASCTATTPSTGSPPGRCR